MLNDTDSWNKRLRKEREARNLTQEDLAEKVGVAEKTIARWEKGTSKPRSTQRASLKTAGFSDQALPPLDDSPSLVELLPTEKSYLPLSIEPSQLQRRPAQVEAVYRLLTQGEKTGVVLTGLAGVGKSTLARLICAYVEQERDGAQGGLFAPPIQVKLDKNMTFADLLVRLAHKLKQPMPDLGSASATGQALLLFKMLNTVNYPGLIVLDQFEYLLETPTGPGRPGAREWIDLLNRYACRCHLLITCHIWPNSAPGDGQEYLQEYHVDGLEIAEGVALLRDSGVQGEPKDLEKAVRRCKGHVIALMLLAQVLQDYRMSLPKLLARSKLWTQDVAGHLLDVLYKDQLTMTHRRVLQAFAIYREAVPTEAAQTILPDMSEQQFFSALRTLLKYELLQPSREDQYQLHDIIEGYVQKNFADENQDGNSQLVEEAHAGAASYYWRRAAAEIRYHRPTRIEDAHFLTEATWHYCQAKRWEQALAVLNKEGIFDRFHQAGGDATFLELYQLVLAGTHGQKFAQRGDIYRRLGGIYHALGELGLARDSYQQALDLHQGRDQTETFSQILLQNTIVLYELGNQEEARSSCERLLQLSERIPDPLYKAHALSYLGWLQNFSGQRAQAIKNLHHALVIFQNIGDDVATGWALNRLGTVYKDLHQWETARDYYERGLVLFRQSDHGSGEAWMLSDLGDVYYHLHNPSQARACLEQALELFREFGGQRGEAWTLKNLGICYQSTGDWQQAQEVLEQALQLFTYIDDSVGMGSVQGDLAAIYFQGGLQEKALESYKEALKLQKKSDPQGLGSTLLHFSSSWVQIQRYDVALASLLIAKEYFAKVGSADRESADKQAQELFMLLQSHSYPISPGDVEQNKYLIMEEAIGIAL